MTFWPVVGAAGFLLMVLQGSGTSTLWIVFVGVLVFGLGLSATVAPLTSAVNNAVARVAALVSTACLGLISGGTVDFDAFHRGVVVIAALMLIGGVVSAVGIRNPSGTGVRA